MPISRGGVLRTVLKVPAILFLCAVMGSGGCVVVAAVTAVAVVVGMPVGYTEKMEFENSPEDVYQATLRAIARDPEFTLMPTDPLKYKVDAFKLKDEITATAVAIDGEKTRLTVKALAGEKNLTHLELAVKVMQNVCEELGVKYQVVPEEEMFRPTPP